MMLPRFAAIVLAGLIGSACSADTLSSPAAASGEHGNEVARLRQTLCGKVIWQADHETADLSQWYSDDGGGEFNSGAALSSASRDIAHSGSYSLQSTIETPQIPDAPAVRLYRWNEGRTHPEACYSAWYYFPQLYVVKDWWNIFSFKSRNRTAANDAFWQLQVANRFGAMYLYLTWWGPPIDGPWPGASGLRHFTQWLREVDVRTWTHLEVYLRQSSDFNGQIIVWQDGVELFNLNNVRTRYPAPNGANEWALNNYSDSIVPSPTTIYIDDAAIRVPAAFTQKY